MRVHQPRQQGAAVPVDHPRRERVRAGFGDRGDPAVVHPDVGELAAEARPDPAQQEIIHGTNPASHTGPRNHGFRTTARPRQGHERLRDAA